MSKMMYRNISDSSVYKYSKSYSKRICLARALALADRIHPIQVTAGGQETRRRARLLILPIGVESTIVMATISAPSGEIAAYILPSTLIGSRPNWKPARVVEKSLA